MAFKIKSSHIVAVLFTAGLGGWMLAGEVNIGGQAESATGTEVIAERESKKDTKLFRVSYVPLRLEERLQSISVRGRTQANAVIPVRAETGGIIEKRLVDKGEVVKVGDLVCVIERGAREADLASAEAQLAQARGEYEANAKLAKKGFASKTRLRQMKFSLDAAKSMVARASLDLARTQVHAKASGVVQDPIAEVGDMLTAGSTCVTLIDADPMLFTGQVSERSVGQVKMGMPADITLVTGEVASGKVRYISPSADASTRTFLVEIELSKLSQTIRDGLTASALIKLPPKQAYRVSPSWLTLADSGEVGLKTIGEEDVVAFQPVTILAQTSNGFWIEGPAPGARVITLGQEYVIAGEKVEPVLDEFIKAETSQ